MALHNIDQIMNFTKVKRELDYPVDLESHLILRMPEEPAKTLREVLKTGENLKNRLTIQIEDDMRHGEVRFDNWVMSSKIVDLPTVIESLKTIDNKSFYKTADLCQMMLCKEGPEPSTSEDDSSAKNKKKDPTKVDKKFLWPHGVTPPTKNVRRRRFRKTLKKKFIEAPEIEKEVKRLLRADNEALSVSWEIIKDDDEQYSSQAQSIPPKTKGDKKSKSDRKVKHASKKSGGKHIEASNAENDIFGGAVSDSDLDEDHANEEVEDSCLSVTESRYSDTNSTQEVGEVSNKKDFPVEFSSQMFQPRKSSASHTITSAAYKHSKSGDMSPEEDTESLSNVLSNENMTERVAQLKAEVEELKQRRQRTQHEISGMENTALRQRFQDILHTLNQDIMYKEMEYQGILTLQNSEDI